ncbi:MAG TPA: hypothetical protein VM533_20695 [Fimbriiglobus sp.]|jgi:hypothetical protein|nr:hypothetical protein [Fimbriiglobus sp.]
MPRTGAPRRFNHDAIANDYSAGLSLSQVARRHGCSPRCVHKVVCRRGQARPRRAGVCDHEYFRIIDTEEKAYWAGFLLADGFIAQNRVNVSVKADDGYHLEKLRQALKAVNPVKVYRQARNSYAGGRFAVFGVASPQLLRDLEPLGVVRNKTGKTEPATGIPQALLRHYWRGVIDGDGYLGYRPRSPGRPLSGFYLGLVGDRAVVEAFREFCRTSTRTAASVRPHKSVFRYLITGRSAARVASLIYDGASVALSRKLDVYIAFRSTYDDENHNG